MTKLSHRIDIWPIERLKPYDRNARTHSVEQVAKIAASLAEFGFVNPILVDQRDGIIAGHGRLMAAKELGLAEVPVIVLDHLSDAQRRAYVLADNKLAELAGWDVDILSDEINWLEHEGFDLELAGFSDEELTAFLGDGVLPEDGAPATPPQKELTPEYVEGQDDAPEVQAEQVTKLGDVWVMGNHRLMCGDSTSVDAVAVLMAGGEADLLLTDPPYNVAYTGKTKDALTIENDSMEDGDFRAFLVAAFRAADFAMRPGAAFYIWHADSEGYNFRGACFDIDWQVRQCLIWAKNVLVMGRQDYHWKHEPCLYGWKPGAAHTWTSDRKQTTVLNFDKPSRNAEHPTMKPVALFEYQMLNNTTPGSVALDLFGGSGTTMIAAEKTGRHSRLMELDPKYCDVIVKRWQEFTGRHAVLESNGALFEEVKRTRSANDNNEADAEAA